MAHDILMIVLLVLGFGFVIFFHELGHFLAAKWVGIRVEQFAVGFGQAIFSWRQGIGLRIGSTHNEYEKRINGYLLSKGIARDDAAADPAAVNQAEQALGLGDTEYRLNWIPLGGYVKMLGQDDLRPNAVADDPRAYNRKSIAARMMVVSAGVIMNIILAAIGFMIVFLIGFHVPPPRVGGLLADSPAQRAGLRVGDVVDQLDGKKQWDFTKIGLNAALLEDGATVPVVVIRDGKRLPLEITPGRLKDDPKEFLSLGIEPYRDLRVAADQVPSPDQFSPEELALKPGETITAIDGKSVQPDDYQQLDSAVQGSYGGPIRLDVRAADGSSHQVEIRGHFEDPYSAGSFHLAGMVPRVQVMSVLSVSPALGKLLPGDIIESVTRANNDPTSHPPTRDQLTQVLKAAGAQRETVSMTVIRRVKGVDKEVVVPDLHTGLKLEGTSSRGLGIGLGWDEQHPVVADVLKDTPAYRASIPAGATLTRINGAKVSSWYDIHRLLLDSQADKPVTIDFITQAGQPGAASTVIDAAQEGAIHAVRYASSLQLEDPEGTPRKTTNPIVAAGWGVTETRDFVLQFYLTLRRMFDGSVSPSNMMGPVGIFIAGKKLAFKGIDWLIWFLAMISANLAVVNFLPIPIVDGGLFTFLVLEKIQGKPVSARTQAIAQYVGLAFLVGVFLFVTYHDITRWF